jgi:hypothetical protein
MARSMVSNVESPVLTVWRSLPIYLDKQTFSESDGMSQGAHRSLLDHLISSAEQFERN